MTDPHELEIEAVNRALEIAIAATGECVAVTLWLDGDGDECGPDDATVAVAGPDEMGRWYAIDLSAFDPGLLN